MYVEKLTTMAKYQTKGQPGGCVVVVRIPRFRRVRQATLLGLWACVGGVVKWRRMLREARMMV